MLLLNSASILRERKEKQTKIRNENLKKLMDHIKQNVLNENLLKQSKHLKSWRERKLLMTKAMIGTFEVHGEKMNATEWVCLNSIQVCGIPKPEKGDLEEKFIFFFYGKDKNGNKLNFRFATATKQSRDRWIQTIKKWSPLCSK